MSKASCRDKHAYYSQEEAAALSLPGNAIYQCPRCGRWHATSKTSVGNKKRMQKAKRYGKQ